MNNIVLIVLDTVRKDYFDENADRLTRQSDCSFEQCRATSAWSVPSHASMFTGKLPHQHGIHTHNQDFGRMHEMETIFDDLDGYSFFGVSSNVYTGNTYGFDTHYDELVEVSSAKRFPEGLSVRDFVARNEKEGLRRYISFLKTVLSHPESTRSVLNGALYKLNSTLSNTRFPEILDDGATSICRESRRLSKQSEPFFMYINFMDAHAGLTNKSMYNQEMHSVSNTWHSSDFDNWEINVSGNREDYEADIQNYRKLYAAAIEYLDRKVSRLIRDIDEKTNNNTVFVITSDHGENLGYPEDEHLVAHSSSLTEGLLHVPLEIINAPSKYDTVVNECFSHLDLKELLAGLADGNVGPIESETIAAEVMGISPGNWSKGDSGGYELSDEEYRYWNRAIRCVYMDGYKYTYDSLGNVNKYELDRGRPCWQREVPYEGEIDASDDSIFTMNIQTAKNKARSSPARERSVDKSTQKRLKELGYM